MWGCFFELGNHKNGTVVQSPQIRTELCVMLAVVFSSQILSLRLRLNQPEALLNANRCSQDRASPCNVLRVLDVP